MAAYPGADGRYHLPLLDHCTAVAQAHCEHLCDGERESFMKAFKDARTTAQRGGDLELLWRSASKYPCSAAGHIEGVASARAEELP